MFRSIINSLLAVAILVVASPVASWAQDSSQGNVSVNLVSSTAIEIVESTPINFGKVSSATVRTMNLSSITMGCMADGTANLSFSSTTFPSNAVFGAECGKVTLRSTGGDIAYTVSAVAYEPVLQGANNNTDFQFRLYYQDGMLYHSESGATNGDINATTKRRTLSGNETHTHYLGGRLFISSAHPSGIYEGSYIFTAVVVD